MEGQTEGKSGKRLPEWRMKGRVGKGRREVTGRGVKPAMQSHGIRNHDGK